MAEVKPIPSAVGAYEAQIFDMSKTYQTLARTYAQARKDAQEMRKKYETELNTVLNDERLIRPQDSDYIDFVKQDTRNFYYQNKDAIERGDSRIINQFNEKKGRTRAAITKSASLKSGGTAITTYVTQTLGKDWEVTNPEFNRLVQDYNAPIGFADGRENEERKNSRIDKGDGNSVSIDELSPLDLKRQRLFTMSDVDTDLKNNLKPISLKLETRGGVTNTYSLYAPNDIASGTASSLSNKPSVFGEYEKKWEQIKNDPEKLKQIDNNIVTIKNSYKGAGTQFGGDKLGSIDYLFKSGEFGTDTKPGITNAFEYAVYEKILGFLPQQIAREYNYDAARYELSVKEFYANERYRKSSLNLQRQKSNGPVSVQDGIITDIRNNTLNPQKTAEMLNDRFGIALPGDEPGAKFDISADGKTFTVSTAIPITLGSGNNTVDVTSFLEASKVTGVGKGIKRDDYFTSGIFKGAGGRMYKRDVVTYTIDPKNPNWTSNINAGVNRAYIVQPAAIKERLKQFIDGTEVVSPGGTIIND